MKTYKVVKVTEWWSTNNLVKKAEQLANQKSQEGYEIVGISFGFSVSFIATAYITLAKSV